MVGTLVACNSGPPLSLHAANTIPSAKTIHPTHNHRSSISLTPQYLLNNIDQRDIVDNAQPTPGFFAIRFQQNIRRMSLKSTHTKRLTPVTIRIQNNNLNAVPKLVIKPVHDRLHLLSGTSPICIEKNKRRVVLV